MADIIGKILGRKVVAQKMSKQMFRKAVKAAGLPKQRQLDIYALLPDEIETFKLSLAQTLSPAFWIARKAKHGENSKKSFLFWNLVGALVIVPAAPIVLQLGLPGAVQVFTSLPDARAVFTYPMSIAAMIGVPLFVLINLLVAWRLWESSKAPVVTIGIQTA